MSRYFGRQAPNRRSEALQTTLFISLGTTLFFTVLAYTLITMPGSNGSSISSPQDVSIAKDLDGVEVLIPMRDIDPHTKLEPSLFRTEHRPAYFSGASFTGVTGAALKATWKR